MRRLILKINTADLLGEVEQEIMANASDGEEYYHVNWDRVTDAIHDLSNAVEEMETDGKGNTLLWSSTPVSELMEMDADTRTWEDVVEELQIRWAAWRTGKQTEYLRDFVRMVSDNREAFFDAAMEGPGWRYADTV